MYEDDMSAVAVADPPAEKENLVWSLGVDGPGWGFSVGDKTWRVVPITQGMKAYLVEWCKQTVIDATMQFQGKMAQPVFRQLLADKVDEIASEKYAWKGAGCLKLLQSPTGLKQLFHQLSLPKNPRVTLEEVAALLESHTEEVTLAIKMVVEDPNWEAAL